MNSVGMLGTCDQVEQHVAVTVKGLWAGMCPPQTGLQGLICLETNSGETFESNTGSNKLI